MTQTPQPLRVLTHSSFELPAELLTGFERQAGVKLQIVKGGDAGDPLSSEYYGWGLIDINASLEALEEMYCEICN